MRDKAIDLVLGDPVVELALAEREVLRQSGARTRFEYCVIATGATPVRPPVPGVDLPGVLTLRSLADAQALRAAALATDRVVVVGSGFIGCEAAASLSRLGLGVTVVSSEPHPQQTRLGAWAASAHR